MPKEIKLVLVRLVLGNERGNIGKKLFPVRPQTTTREKQEKKTKKAIANFIALRKNWNEISQGKTLLGK